MKTARPAGARLTRPGPLPAADADGYLQTPNVNSLMEMMDMRQAQRSYEANLNMISTARSMMMRTLDLLKA